MNFIVSAIGEVLVGVFVYIIFDPSIGGKYKGLFKYTLNPDKFLFNLQTEAIYIKQANKAFLQFCVGIAVLILINWFFVRFFNIYDLKDFLLIITILIVFSFRFLYVVSRKRKK